MSFIVEPKDEAARSIQLLAAHPDPSLPPADTSLPADEETAVWQFLGGWPSRASLDVILPVFNEEMALPGCVTVLHAYLERRIPLNWTITIVDNASTDSTRALAAELSSRLPRVRSLNLDRKGKGYALRTAWTSSDADIVAYMDVDLSTGLDALPLLLAALISGHSDIVVGSRTVSGSRIIRSRRREVISRCYNMLLAVSCQAHFRDAQCGFKAARAATVRPLLGQVKDNAWFFDTELLLLAQRSGLRVQEIPVDWIEDLDSRVQLVAVSLASLRGIGRMALSRTNHDPVAVAPPMRPTVRSAPQMTSSHPTSDWRPPGL